MNPIPSLFEHIAGKGSNPCGKLPTIVFDTPEEAARMVALEIAAIIRQKLKLGEPCVLGLATGSTPVAVYRELVRFHRTEGLSFSNVTTFNLDEYYPCAPDSLISNRRFMQENLFDHIDIDPDRTHVPEGAIERDQVPGHCQAYEACIQAAGGIDLQLLGIGRTGHIAFNEPGSSGSSRTRLVTLHATTLIDNRKLNPEMDLPAQAITMGVGTILDAHSILVLAFGEHKRAVVKAAIGGPVSTDISASFLQNHANAIAVLDNAAAG